LSWSRLSGAVGNDVLPEVHPALSAPVGGEGLERLGAVAHAALGIDRGDGAARARLHHAQRDRAGADAPPVVLGMRGGAGDDEVRSEAPHRQRTRQPPVELVERALADEQQREAVGERGLVARRAVGRVDGPAHVVREPHQPAGDTEVHGEPAVGGLGHGPRRDRVAPDRDDHRFPRPVVRQLEVGTPRRAQHQGVGRDGRRDRRHGGQITLRQEAPGLVDHHPVPVPAQAARRHLGVVQRDSPARLHGVDPELGDAQRRHVSANLLTELQCGLDFSAA
jgi:hypothetical protein